MAVGRKGTNSIVQIYIYVYKQFNFVGDLLDLAIHAATELPRHVAYVRKNLPKNYANILGQPIVSSMRMCKEMPFLGSWRPNYKR